MNGRPTRYGESRMRAHPLFLASFLALSIAATGDARAFAQGRSASDLDSARAALTEAQALRDAGNLDAALSKYKAAHAMAGTAITAYELGRCHLDLGHLVEAHELLLSVARIPRNPNETARADAARSDAVVLADKLEPKIPTITVRVAGAMPTDVTLTLDGSAIPPEAIGAKRRVDPGAHTIIGKTSSGEVQSAQLTVAAFDSKDATLTFVKAVVATTPESEDDKRFGMRVRFVKPPEPDVEPDELWTLHARDGATICTLPCERWVRASSNDYVEVSANNGSVHKRVDMPMIFQFAHGTSIVVHPVTERGTPNLAALAMVIMIFPYLGGIVVGTTVLAICAGNSPSCDGLGGVGGGWAILGASIVLPIVHIAWSAWTRHSRLNVDESSAGATFTPQVSLVPGAVRLDTKSVHTWFTPAGVMGVF